MLQDAVAKRFIAKLNSNIVVSRSASSLFCEAIACLFASDYLFNFQSSMFMLSISLDRACFDAFCQLCSFVIRVSEPFACMPLSIASASNSFYSSFNLSIESQICYSVSSLAYLCFVIINSISDERVFFVASNSSFSS